MCSSTSFSEGLALESVRPHNTISLIVKQCNASTLRHSLPERYSARTVHSAWADYQQMVKRYSPRQLTHESDVLRAVSGYLNHLHRISKNRFISGMSLGLFHDALLWVPESSDDHRHYSRKRIYASWSWAGWKGAVTYQVFPASDQPLIEGWRAVWIDERSGSEESDMLAIPLLEEQNDRLISGFTFLPGRKDAADREAANGCRDGGKLVANPLQCCCLLFEASIATL